MLFDQVADAVAVISPVGSGASGWAGARSEDVVVVSHSLGTVVAFNLLRELSDAGVSITVPLFVTLGSPLGIREVQRWVGGTFGVPKAVGTWMSFYDKGDPITLGRPFSTHFAAGIVDTIVDNNTDNGHSIAGYLDDKAVINPINMALRSAWPGRGGTRIANALNAHVRRCLRGEYSPIRSGRRGQLSS